jgi:hypothetical protein
MTGSEWFSLVAVTLATLSALLSHRRAARLERLLHRATTQTEVATALHDAVMSRIRGAAQSPTAWERMGENLRQPDPPDLMH